MFPAILVAETIGFEPAQSHRTRNVYDDPLLCGREVAGSRLQYRLNQGVSLDYGKYYSSDYATETLVIREDFVDILQQCRTYCHK